MASKRVSISATLVLLAVLAFFAVAVRAIRTQSPYPAHVDEEYLLDHGWDVASSGDLNPHFFNYGSLPIYLTALSLRTAAQVAQLRGEIAQLSEVDPISFPYYDHPNISLAPRFVFALWACIALGALALIARALGARGEAVLLPVLALMLNPVFQVQAYAYVNVDIMATAIVTTALAYLLRNLERESHWARWLAPALFTAAACATKYNAALLFVPFVAAIARRLDRASLWQLLGFGVATPLAFLLFQPFAALDFSAFWDAVQSEREHYQTGHAGHEAEPGLAQAHYYARQIYKQLGPVLLSLTLLGIVHGLRTRRTATLLLLLFPLSSLTLMILQRVHFLRNVLPAVTLLTAFSALGLTALQGWLVRGFDSLAEKLRATRLRAQSAWLGRAASAGLLAAMLGLFPRARPRGTFEPRAPDSRQILAEWLREHAGARDCMLVIPLELGFSPRTLEPYCTLRTFDVVGHPPTELASELSSLRTRPETYLALPLWDMSPMGRPTDDSPDEWNALPERLALGHPVLRRGRGAVRRNRPRRGRPPPGRLYRLQPSGTP